MWKSEYIRLQIADGNERLTYSDKGYYFRLKNAFIDKYKFDVYKNPEKSSETIPEDVEYNCFLNDYKTLVLQMKEKEGLRDDKMDRTSIVNRKSNRRRLFGGKNTKKVFKINNSNRDDEGRQTEMSVL